jgi:hypothetical protein
VIGAAQRRSGRRQATSETPVVLLIKTARGGILQDSGYDEVWDQARQAPSPPPSTGHRSAAAPTTCATRLSPCG